MDGSRLRTSYVIADHWTASFNALPGLNAGTLLALISISSPV
jgi:hypothetical protein